MAYTSYNQYIRKFDKWKKSILVQRKYAMQTKFIEKLPLNAKTITSMEKNNLNALYDALRTFITYADRQNWSKTTRDFSKYSQNDSDLNYLFWQNDKKVNEIRTFNVFSTSMEIWNSLECLFLRNRNDLQFCSVCLLYLFINSGENFVLILRIMQNGISKETIRAFKRFLVFHLIWMCTIDPVGSIVNGRLFCYNFYVH